eukprot:CAMPEP_0198211166 /NCGR_PEP_ID=MMETSP1445-20131203/22662_1 /TAXON_ID=36898 /ORGANISM="Pyramimonas sp., Strain CCMP2087" /LENGTH=668 /DNA_ID=CAMNT_0043885377 /DNA_START=271 /DNA_END=2273 /DNA_ORIENTATION=-
MAASTMNISASSVRLSSGIAALNRSSSASAFSTGTVLPKNVNNASVSGLLLARTAVSPIQCSSFPGSEPKRRGVSSQAAASFVSELSDDTQEGDMQWPTKGSVDGEERIEADATQDENELSIENFGLSQTTKAALRSRGIENLFPIQAGVLKPAMEGRDVIGRARTGTGKTLAFSLPVIEKLLEQRANGERPGRLPKCVILAPTRELAKQVEREIAATSPSLRQLCCYGGVSIMNHERDLKRGVDIVVGTPGRMIDLMQRGALDLSEVQFSILDEADQMLSVGFEEDVEMLYAKMPTDRTNYLFSATMPTWVSKLARNYLTDPVTVDLVGDNRVKIADTLKVLSINVPAAARKSVLVDLLTVYGRGAKAIVFTQTKREADEVNAALGKALQCEALHGDIAQWQREKTLSGFREGRFNILVATDVAARGLDVPDVELVVHYELPQDNETFLHRSGRAGRAGKKGTAILMYTNRDRRTVTQLERIAGVKFDPISGPTPEQTVAASADQATATLNAVSSEVLPYFQPAAKKLIASGRPVEELLAAALAAVSGMIEAPVPRSLITMEEGKRTVLIRPSESEEGEESDSRRRRGLMMPSEVVRALREVLPPSADIGKIKMTLAEGGAVLDLNMTIADELAERDSIPGMVVEIITALPELEREREEFSGGRNDR